MGKPGIGDLAVLAGIGLAVGYLGGFVFRFSTRKSRFFGATLVAILIGLFPGLFGLLLAISKDSEVLIDLEFRSDLLIWSLHKLASIFAVFGIPLVLGSLIPKPTSKLAENTSAMASPIPPRVN